MKNTLKKNNIEDSFTKFIALVVFITNVTQLPYFVESSLARFISLPVWISVFILCLFQGLIVFSNKTLFPIINMALLSIGILVLSILTNKDYLNPGIVYCYYLSMFIFFVGYWISKKISYDGLRYIIGSYIISTIILTLNIYLKYFSSGFNIMSSVYAYGSKNSVSQIIFTSLVFLFIVHKPISKIMVVVKWILIVFHGIVILFLKSRATVLGMVVMVCIPILLGKAKKNIRISAILMVVILAIILSNDNFYDIVLNGIIFGGRDASNLNSLSSGRYAEWITFPDVIYGNEFWGIGKYKFESFPLSVLAQYGFIIGTLFIILSIWPIIWSFNKLKKDNLINIAFIIISCSYWINGIFEQLAPFGPGVKCYMLWLMFGILHGKERNI